MTQAVCFNCGAVKFGAFAPCPECGTTPRTDEDLMRSLVMTDHYLDLATMQQMGRAIKDGRPPKIDKATRANFLKMVADFRKDPMARFAIGEPPQRKRKRRWWPF